MAAIPATSPPPGAASRARCAARAKNRTGTCVRAYLPPLAPPAATAAASALPQPSVHNMHGLTRLVRAALAVVCDADVSPTRRRQGRHRAPPGGRSGRCGAYAPPQVRARGRGRRQRMQGCGWRARSAQGRGRCPRCGRQVARRRPRFGARLGFGVPAAAARWRPLGRRGGLEAAPGGSGLPWGCWVVAPGPARAARERLRSRCGRCRA